MKITRPPFEKFCAFCGQPFAAPLNTWPKFCDCGQPTFRNPIPVVSLLQPVTGVDTNAVLLIQRNIEPCFGEFALPGGYMELDETWQEAAAREFFEETQLSVEVSQIDLLLLDSNPRRDRLLIFGITPAMSVDALPETIVNSEVSSYALASGPKKLAFEAHERALALYFSRF